MEGDGSDSGAVLGTDADDTRSAVNKLILDYYKKIGRKRDLEQYFSLSTAQNDMRDPSGSFWRKMKTQDDSSDSGGKKSESSHELCRISIRCSLPDPSSSQDEKTKSNSGSPAKSPPIIVDDCVEEIVKNSDDEYEKSDDNHSQKSFDILDTSMNPRSPTSSVTSQRKLEWDSLADVGYANESDRKNSASSLSTLERLALKQQYTNNDSEKGSQLGLPTATSTPLDDNENKSKPKKGLTKKTKFYKKDVDFVEVNIPQTNDINPSQSINVNLTKHISFNVQKDGGVTVENVIKDVNVKKSPEMISVETEVTPQVHVDKEIQTSSLKTKDKSVSSDTPKQSVHQKLPVMISLNTLRKRNRQKKLRCVRKKQVLKKKPYVVKHKEIILDKSGEQLSEAESFEYMPGHVYNQNHLKLSQSKTVNAAGNKSSLESSGLLTTDSSKGSKYSFKQDLEKSIDLLKSALQEHGNDGSPKIRRIKTKLLKEVIHRLLNSKYRDDDSTTDFLSGLSFKSNKIGLQDSNHTTSTSDGNTLEKAKNRPKKSILRLDKFNSNAIASTSQSAPNLPAATNSDKPFTSNLIKSLLSTNTDTDASSRDRISSDNVFTKTSSEELYQKYLEALKKEEAYRKHLRDKEILLKQKLRNSDSGFKVPIPLETKISGRMKELMRDLTRNNFDDGSGDASKLERSSNFDVERCSRSQRSHSVFTLSSGRSERQNKKPNQSKRQQSEDKELNKAGSSKREHYCCCPHHSKNSTGVIDSSVQVNIRDSSMNKSRNPVESHTCTQKANIEPNRNVAHFVSDVFTGDVKYVCLCDDKVATQEIPDNYLIYKCSRLTNSGVQSDDLPTDLPVRNMKKPENDIDQDKNIHNIYEAISSNAGKDKNLHTIDSNHSINLPAKKPSKSSQTNLLLKMLCGKSSDRSITSSPIQKHNKFFKENDSSESEKKKTVVKEATICVQTEISINPQISDPCLSDINVMSDRDCFKLISEHCRQVSRRSSETGSKSRESQSDIEACTSSENIKPSNLKDSNNQVVANLQDVNSEINKTNSVSQCEIPLTTDNLPDNFTIPIQGTNMMLMVTIGSNIQFPGEKQKEIVNQSIETVKLENVEESTSLVDECSKAVQNNNSTIEFNKPSESDHNTNDIFVKSVYDDTLKNPCVANVSKDSTGKFNTFPRDDKKSTFPKDVKKSFLRSNTDTELIENVNFMPNDSITQIKTTIEENHDKTSYVNTDNKLIKSYSIQSDIAGNLEQQCPCGCSLKLTECKGGCGNKKDGNIKAEVVSNNMETIEYFLDNKQEDTDSRKSLMKRTVVKKDIGTQKDLPPEQPKPLRNDDTYNAKIRNSKDTNFAPKPRETNRPVQTQKSDLTSTSKESETQESSVQTIEDHKSSQNAGNNSNSNNIINTASSTEKHMGTEPSINQDPVLNMIRDITKRYSKTDIEKNKRKKCFKEIVTVLNYLLDTDESSDNKQVCNDCGNCNPENSESNSEPQKTLKKDNQCISCQTKILVDKAVQLTGKKKKTEKPIIESSDLPTSTDVPETSTDSATCKVLNKIKKECEKYHQKRCKSYSGKICEASSSTSAHCDQCRRSHHCSCRGHKCKRSKNEKAKKPVAYNLIIQTSESMISEETVCSEQCRPLKNIVVKVPSRYKKLEKAPFKEVACKIEQKMTIQNLKNDKTHRSRSLPNECEMSSSGELRPKSPTGTVRDYLERNRPDFVEKCSQRQNCLKYISESRNDSCNNCAPSNLKMIVIHNPACSDASPNNNVYCRGIPMNCSPCFGPCVQTVQNEVTRLANERAAQRDLLSLHVDQESPLSALSLGELRHLAKEIGIDPSAHKQPKLISEREMKKRSEKIYKSLPEVVQKKEELKKENTKKTNLLMANIFKKNLQKKALRGSVNLSNYSTVIKI